MRVRAKSRTYTVGQVNKYIYNLLAGEPFLEHVTVEGEVSNLTYHRSGHIYFDLKDETGKLACAMFRGSRGGLTYRMAEGDKVAASGQIGVYPRNGTYQLVATYIEAAGAGELFVRFAQLKKELAEMGMFDASYKQTIPSDVRRLGIVTAPTGAAVRDIIRIALRRDPGLHIILYPALVQGDGAVTSVCEGIAALDALGVDVMIVGRGGGSIEDLWAFNEEAVARAIFGCRTPIISAVGHETDVTIADFVADLRAATPSEAAELAVADRRERLAALARYQAALSRAMERRLQGAMQRADGLERRLVRTHPSRRLAEERRHLSRDYDRLQAVMDGILLRTRHRLELVAKRYDAASPAKRLAAGYSYVTDEKGARIRSIQQLTAGDEVRAYVTDGSYTATVNEVRADG